MDDSIKISPMQAKDAQLRVLAGRRPPCLQMVVKMNKIRAKDKSEVKDVKRKVRSYYHH